METEPAPTLDIDLGAILGMLGDRPFAPPLPERAGFGAVIPAPRKAHLERPRAIRSAAISLRGEDAPGARRILTDGLLRSGIELSRDGFPIDLAYGSMPSDEAYELDASTHGMTLRAAGPVGLARAAATARQLCRSTPQGMDIVCGRVVDAPTVDVRMLAGWGTYRAHRVADVLEVAIEGKFNRVLYNWWAAAPAERMGPSEERAVASAREIGVELVCELRRQAWGPTFNPKDSADVASVLARYDEAVDRGFRCFGLLFDDSDHDPVSDELDLLATVVEHLTSRLGGEPEFYYCPRYYWFPGQMDYSWMGALLRAMGGSEDANGLAQSMGLNPHAVPRSQAEVVELQERFQHQLGKRLARRTNVYLANWFSAAPEDFRSRLEEGWTSRVGRPPVFWDNQMQNDFRAALVYPFPVHQRPAEFADCIAGYALNSGVPLDAYAPGSITAGAWAWNPAGYDAAVAFGTAITRVFGDAAGYATSALAAWGELVGELMGARIGLENHYAGLRTKAAAGDTDDVRRRLDRIAGAWAQTLDALPACAHPIAYGAVGELRREVDRLRLDLELTEIAMRSPDASGGRDARARAKLLRADIARILAGRLPPVPELREHAQADIDAGSLSLDGVSVSGVPGISWLLHFFVNPLATAVDPLVAEIGRGD